MTAQTKPRPSRASRAAKQADQDPAQPKPEQCPHDLDPATCAECNGSAAAERQAEAKPEPKPEPAGPYATVSSEPVMMPYFRGVAEIRAAGPDGAEIIERLVCTCRWAHTDEAIAAKCGRRLAAKRGLK